MLNTTVLLISSVSLIRLFHLSELGDHIVSVYLWALKRTCSSVRAAPGCCSISGCLPIPQIQLLRLFCSVILPSSSLTGLLWLYVVAKKQKQLQCFLMKNIWKLYVPVPRLGSFDLLPKHDQRAFFSWNTVFWLPGPKHFVLTP